ncbi:MAG: dUTP diphosphatase [Inquilinaceae bacterium]
MTDVTIPVLRLAHGRDLPLPAYATDGSAGVDLMAAIDDTRELVPGERMLVPTGLSIALPRGYEAQIRPRSGLALKHGLTVLNSPGTIDADYRGEIAVLLINFGQRPVSLTPGMRIAQMVIAKHALVVWRETATLDETERAVGGFGSTGTAR